MITTNRLTTALSEGSMLTFLILVTGFLMMYVYGRALFRQIQLSLQIPGPSFKAIFETSYKTISADPVDMYKIGLELSKVSKDITKIWIGPKLVIFLFNPADIELILGSNVHLDKSTEYSVFKPWFGNGLLISSGNKWKLHRKMIAPTFHQSILKNFVPTFYQNSIKVCNKMRHENGKQFDCHEYMSGTTVDILLETAMGYKEPRSEETGFNYAMAVMKLCDILHRRHYKAWLRPDYFFQKTKWAADHSRLLKVIMSLTTKVVKSKKRDYLKKISTGEIEEDTTQWREEDDTVLLKQKNTTSSYAYVRDDLDENDENDVGEKKRLAFLDQLTTNAQKPDVDFTEQEVLDQVNTIMFEGHDTTAAGSSFFLTLMGIHQDIQEKCMQEINDIFQGSNRECTFNDTLEMRYLERVILEALRMYPPVPLIARLVKEEVKMASGDYTLPIGATIVIPQVIVHRRPDQYPNPDVFNPDNFLPEKCQDRHYYSFIPFSAGPRSCVGRKYAMLKLKVLLSTILRQFKVSTTLSEEDFDLQADIILKLNKGFNIRLEPRQTAVA